MRPDPKILIADFEQVARCAKAELPKNSIKAKVLVAGRTHVCKQLKLPHRKMAVYVFFLHDNCLKVGKAGPKSHARFAGHHYNPNSSKSNLAKWVLRKQNELGVEGLNERTVGQWLEHETDRINFLLDKRHGATVLNLLEAFLQCRLNPESEGFESQKRSRRDRNRKSG